MDSEDDSSYSDSDNEDVHVPRLVEDDPEEQGDDFDKELQAALSAGLVKPSLISSVSTERPKINNKAGLIQALEGMEQTDLNWAERLDLTIDVTEFKDDEETENGETAKFDVNNDFKRELVFYEQAKEAVLQAREKFQIAGIPTKRPDDYFAQMAKRDEHMRKLREKLVIIRKRKEEADRNRKNFQARKYGKQVQQAVTLERQKKKRDMLKSVKNYQKGKTQNLDFLDDDQASTSHGKKSNQPKESRLQQLTKNMKGNNKRAHRNKKFGFGGKKRNLKSNSKESHGDVSGFKKSVHGNKKNKRPGKNRRMQNKKRA